MSYLVHVPWGHEAGSTLDASQRFPGWEVFMVLLFITCEHWISHCKVVAEQFIDLGFINIVFPCPSQEILSRDNISIGFRLLLTLLCFPLGWGREGKLNFYIKHNLSISNCIFQQQTSGLIGISFEYVL